MMLTKMSVLQKISLCLAFVCQYLIRYLFLFKISSHCWNVCCINKLKYKSVQKAQKGQAITTGLDSIYNYVYHKLFELKSH